MKSWKPGRLITVRTGPNGYAIVGSIRLDGIEIPVLDKTKLKSKQPGEPADYHHPTSPVLLAVVGGRHTIYIDGPDGEIAIELVAGDYILFLDFAPETPPAGGLRSGHRSVAGPAGASLQPNVLTTAVDVDSLDWQEGLPVS